LGAGTAPQRSVLMNAELAGGVVNFGIMFFPTSQRRSENKYQLLIDAAKYADEHGFCAIWTPERHFHEFGGLFPNPSLTSAALAMITSRIQIRAGSLISPLHDTIRIAEEWSFVDNLSGGRVAISFGSGWNLIDFIFFPERYARRQAIMYEQVEAVKRLWAGGHISRTDSLGNEVMIALYPKPVQKELPIWVTSSGNVDTFISAGAIGANILTHLMGQDIEKLAGKIQQYRESLEANNFDPDGGKVSLMLHTYIGRDLDEVREKVRTPFREYLRSAISLEQEGARSGGAISGGHKIAPHDISKDMLEDLLDHAFERYFNTAALMGTPSSCKQLIWQLKEIGVDEIACLIDFLDDDGAIIEGLDYLNELRASFSENVIKALSDDSRNAFIESLES
jgi:natural product biosynthesis luciferase-like monooxygenase protein